VQHRTRTIPETTCQAATVETPKADLEIFSD
jgi:hypothetical protein